MLVAETVARIRREIFVKGKSFKEIGRNLKEQVDNQVGLVRERFLTLYGRSRCSPGWSTNAASIPTRG